MASNSWNSVSGTPLWFCTDSNGDAHSGSLIFRPTIPQGSTVTSAIVNITSGNNSVSPLTPNNVSITVSGGGTSIYISWPYIPSFISGSSAYYTPDLTSAINSIVKSSGWSSGSTITIYINQSAADAYNSYRQIAIAELAATWTIPPTCNLTADDTSITSGDSTWLRWTATDATSASIDQGIGSVNPLGSQVGVYTPELISPTVSTTYTLTVNGTGGTSTCFVTVTVIPIPDPPPEPPKPPEPPPGDDPYYIVESVLVLNAGADDFSGTLPKDFHPLNFASTVEEIVLSETTVMADDITVNVTYGPPETVHEATISEGMTTADSNFAELPGESEDPASGTVGESFTTADEITVESSSEVFNEGVVLTDVIEGDTPYRDIAESMALDDTLSSADSIINTTNAEDVELSDDISAGFLIEDTNTEDVELSDDISAERELGIVYQSEGMLIADEILAGKEISDSISEVQQIFDTLGWTWIKSLESTAEISDEVSVEVGIPIYDVLTAQDAVESQWSGTESVESTLGLFGNAVIIQIFNEAVTSTADIVDATEYFHRLLSSVTSSMNAADTVSSKATFNPVVLESVAIAGLLSVLHTLNLEVSDSAAIADSLGFGWIETIEDEAAIVDAAAVRLLIINLLTSNLVATDAAAGNLNLTDELMDTLGIAATVVIKQILQEHITDILHFGITVELDGELWECWVLNTNAFHASVYSNYGFNSYAVYNNTAYGCKSDGIYELSGDTDDGTAFKTGIVMPQTNFGSVRNKRFRRAYFGISGSSLSLKVEDETYGSKTYTITNSKANISRSQKGKLWTLKVQGFDDIEQIDLVPIILTR